MTIRLSAAKIKSKMDENKITGVQLRKMTNLQYNTIIALMTNTHRNITKNQITKICSALNCTVEDLIC